MKRPKNAIEKREYRDYNIAFEFYVTGNKGKNGQYPIYRYIPCINGCGRWTYTVGDSEWVEQSKVIETYKNISK